MTTFLQLGVYTLDFLLPFVQVHSSLMHFLASQILQTTFLQVRKKIKTDPSKTYNQNTFFYWSGIYNKMNTTVLLVLLTKRKNLAY